MSHVILGNVILKNHLYRNRSRKNPCINTCWEVWFSCMKMRMEYSRRSCADPRLIYHLEYETEAWNEIDETVPLQLERIIWLQNSCLEKQKKLTKDKKKDSYPVVSDYLYFPSYTTGYQATVIFLTSEAYSFPFFASLLP